MTSTVLRVKRRLEDNPQDALVLMCKRIKRDAEEVSSSLFVFRGTVDSQETTNVQNIVPRSKAKLKPSHSISDIIEKIRQEKKDISTQSRYEVVNCNRGLQDSDAKEQYDLVDLQKNEDVEGEVQYAYDLYTAAKQDFDVSMLDNLVSIENYETDLIFGSYREGYGQSSDEADDDDDSNDENNWRNDYPDSEHSSINEEDMIKAMQNVDLEDDLSSDTGEDKIYDHPNPFNEDALRYGPAYAKYKAKFLSEDGEINVNFVHTSTVPDFGYKDDSDDGFYYGQEENTDQFREQYGNDSSDCDPD
ncbi:probable RNA polymerase II nuclear localization protein SLC7A6OS [Plodia interpunctella]|uniref:probable RNA polymerase II nuclear localization protein SLC7A6OS n=1 Tax=Plodia interpunctella TaxID=58824 RepID=UPI0023688110|nr:probable RNA polymerase II nuclear localization protein SLC7A6OS [Plodia interpunctella]